MLVVSHNIEEAVMMADRVLIFASDPGRVRDELRIALPRPRNVESAQIRSLVESREGVGKAGGYAIQGRAESLIKEISGSYSNVVGLPLALTVGLLEGCGYG